MHESGCSGCDVCSGKIEDREKWEKEKLDKNGFYAHLVPSEDGGSINAHTHGFESTWGHKDFQIVLPIDAKIIMDIFWGLADRVKDGEVFQPGTSVERVIRSLPVKLELAKEMDREVLRVILPDGAARFPGDYGVDEMYASQISVEGGIQ